MGLDAPLVKNVCCDAQQWFSSMRDRVRKIIDLAHIERPATAYLPLHGIQAGSRFKKKGPETGPLLLRRAEVSTHINL